MPLRSVSSCTNSRTKAHSALGAARRALAAPPLGPPALVPRARRRRVVPELLQVAVPHAVQLVAKRPDDEGGVVAILADLLGEAAHLRGRSAVVLLRQRLHPAARQEVHVGYVVVSIKVFFTFAIKQPNILSFDNMKRFLVKIRVAISQVFFSSFNYAHAFILSAAKPSSRSPIISISSSAMPSKTSQVWLMFPRM